MKTIYPETDVTLRDRPAPSLDDAAPEVSIFLPVFNEEPNLRPLQARLDEALQKLGRTAEIIYVDDGSNDGSLNVLRELAAKDPRVRVIALRRNYGQTPAMAAGITDQCWSVRELLSYHVPPPRWTPPKQRGRPSHALKRLIERWCGDHG